MLQPRKLTCYNREHVTTIVVTCSFPAVVHGTCSFSEVVRCSFPAVVQFKRFCAF